MKDAPHGVIFSDLDGTFLDAAYRPILERSAFARVLTRWRVIWTSSRTADELLYLQRELGHADDAIGENGGVVVTRDGEIAHALGATTAVHGAWIARLGARRDTTEARVRNAFAEQGLDVSTFADLDADELARRSGYARDDAERARHRRASVMLADLDLTDPRVTRALANLRSEGCDVDHGERWVSVVHGANKGTAARALLDIDPSAPSAGVVAAVGNADNDAGLLASADMGYVIASLSGTHPPRLAAIPGVRLLQQPGTTGWLEMLDHLATLKRPQ